MTSLAKDSILFSVIITEYLLILIINAVTITAFARRRHLRKRSTYLIINLTAADLLVGAVTGPLHVYHKMEDIFGLTWRGAIVIPIDNIFPIASIVNLCLISLDRLHATLFPFRHCLIGKRFYFKIILISWFASFLLAALMAGLFVNEEYSTFSYVWVSFSNSHPPCPRSFLYPYCFKCSKESPFTKSWFNSHRKETIRDVIHSHFGFYSYNSALDYL